MIIASTGDVRCIYDEMLELASLGSLDIQRGSHVEPDSHGQWFADLSPVAGPRLGPFSKRSDALAAETEWLEHYWLDNLAANDASTGDA